MKLSSFAQLLLSSPDDVDFGCPIQGQGLCYHKPDPWEPISDACTKGCSVGLPVPPPVMTQTMPLTENNFSVSIWWVGCFGPIGKEPDIDIVPGATET